MMKLRNSKTERNIRDGFIKSHESLFNDDDKKRLLNVIREHFPEMKTAYVLGWTPEQGEDIYSVLINKELVATIELNRHDLDAKAFVEQISIQKYKYKLSKLRCIELLIAVDLAGQDLKVGEE